jgi:hypothetical protein
MKRIYISGPMTGMTDWNYPAFNAKASELRAMGLEVVNPAEDKEPNLEWSDYLRIDIRLLMNCDGIYMLPGWSKSRGARLEHHVARELGFAVIYEAAS